MGSSAGSWRSWRLLGPPFHVEQFRNRSPVLFCRANTMPFTETDAENLRRAIADGRGARSMTFADQTVVFNSIEDMLDLLGRMEREAAGALGTGRSYRVAAHSKGL